MNAIIQVFGQYDDRYQTLRTIWVIGVFFFTFIQMYLDIALVKGKKSQGLFLNLKLIPFFPRML